MIDAKHRGKVRDVIKPCLNPLQKTDFYYYEYLYTVNDIRNFIAMKFFNLITKEGINTLHSCYVVVWVIHLILNPILTEFAAHSNHTLVSTLVCAMLLHTSQ